MMGGGGAGVNGVASGLLRLILSPRPPAWGHGIDVRDYSPLRSSSSLVTA